MNNSEDTIDPQAFTVLVERCGPARCANCDQMREIVHATFMGENAVGVQQCPRCANRLDVFAVAP